MENGNGSAVVVARDVTRRYGEGDTRRRRAPRRLGRRRAGQADRRDGAVRLRQVDADAHPRGPRQADRRATSTIAGTEITTLGDNDLTKLRREHIGFVFQFFNLLPMLTAEENILLPLTIAGEKPEDGLVRRADPSASGSPTGSTHRPAELSGGQQQRVAIARALVSQPTVVFADEPTGNLDSTTSDEILELLRALGRRVRPDDRDGHARRARRGDRRPGPLPRRRRDRPRHPALEPARDPARDGRARAARDPVRAQGPRRAASCARR